MVEASAATRPKLVGLGVMSWCWWSRECLQETAVVLEHLQRLGYVVERLIEDDRVEASGGLERLARRNMKLGALIHARLGAADRLGVHVHTHITAIVHAPLQDAFAATDVEHGTLRPFIDLHAADDQAVAMRLTDIGQIVPAAAGVALLRVSRKDLAVPLLRQGKVRHQRQAEPRELAHDALTQTRRHECVPLCFSARIFKQCDQPHRKARALPFVAADSDCAAVQFDGVLDDRQAQACSCDATHIAGTVK